MIRVIRETKQTPCNISERISHTGGLNRFNEPNFRVVWGWNRLGWVAGEWEDRDESGRLIRRTPGSRFLPIYFPLDRWHVERWLPPEFYGPPERWRRQTAENAAGKTVEALGPYPSRGEYEHCFTLSGHGGEFVPLTATACDYIIQAIEWQRALPPERLKEALVRREEQRERGWHRHADAALDL